MQLYDINNDGKITLDEVEEIARAIYALLGYYVSPSYDRKTSDERAKQLFSKLDPHNQSFVTKDDFIRICSRVSSLARLYASKRKEQKNNFRSLHLDRINDCLLK